MQQQTALIDPTPPAGDEQRVNKVFGMAEEMIGFVPAALRLYGVSPPLLESFAGTVGYFRAGTRLSPRLTATIRYLVSDRIGCRFCIDMNEKFLVDMGADLDQVREARNDVARAPLEDERERSLLQLALEAVSNPQGDKAPMVEVARQAGWTDRDIFDAVFQAASNRALNFVLKTFNVESQTVFV